MAVDNGLDLSIALGRDDRGDAAILQVCEDGVGVVALVAHEHLGLRPRLGHDRRLALDVGDLAAGEDHRDRQAQAVGPQMDLGREATARAAKTLVLSARFFWAPAACWWARTIVLSIIWTLSWPSPLSLRAASSTSQTPDSVQRRNCR